MYDEVKNKAKARKANEARLRSAIKDFNKSYRRVKNNKLPLEDRQREAVVMRGFLHSIEFLEWSLEIDKTQAFIPQENIEALTKQIFNYKT